MKILVSGDWTWSTYAPILADALEANGAEVIRHQWPAAPQRYQVGRRLQWRYAIGPVLGGINEGLVKAHRRASPDATFVFRGTHVTTTTLQRLKAQPGGPVVGYNNDDPFGHSAPFYYWRHFLRSLPTYDHVYAYREHNVHDFKRHGAPSASLLRSWFDPAVHRPVELTREEREQHECDVTFIGHYEPDGRGETIRRLVDAGVHVRLYGTGWDGITAKGGLLADLAPVQPVRGAAYARALCGAKIALAFLSKANRDTYTRRNFEIPATGTFMLSEHTDDLASLFQDGHEAAFFRTAGECVDLVQRYLADDAERSRVARRGRERVMADGHDVVARARQIIEDIERQFQ